MYEGGDERSGLMKGRGLVAVAVAALLIAADLIILTMVVPWAEERFVNPFMSAGYIITFFLLLVNFVTVLALVAYMFHQDSYPSDRWK